MKHIFYFLLIWIIANMLIGGIGLYTIAAIDHISAKEVLRLFDLKISYIFITQVLGFLSTLSAIWFICSKETHFKFEDIVLNLGSAKMIWPGVLFGFFPIFIIAFVLYLFKDINYSIGSYNIIHIFVLFITLVIGALNEEILIRGYVLKYLLIKHNKYLSLIISSVFFAFFHIINNDIGVISFLNIFLAGIYLGLFYIYFKNLWFSVAAHFVWNFLQGPVLGSAVSGLKTDSLFRQNLVGEELITGGAFGFEASIICTMVLSVFILVLYLFCQGKKKIITEKGSKSRIAFG